MLYRKTREIGRTWVCIFMGRLVDFPNLPVGRCLVSVSRDIGVTRLLRPPV